MDTKKTREQLVENLPKEIDGVLMEDQELEERFNASVKQYGGVSLYDDKKEALKLQPNFAVFDDIDDLNFMVNTEKTFNALLWSEKFRWNREMEEEGVDEGEISNEGENQDTFYNEETRKFDATKIKHFGKGSEYRNVPNRWQKLNLLYVETDWTEF